MRLPAVLAPILVALLLPAAAPAQAKPARETQAGIATYQPDAAFARQAPSATVAVGRGVVTSADPRATEAGRQMLARGGSAADAAIATMIALTVAEPQSSGIGGGAFVTFREGRTGRIIAIDGRETAPAAARPNRFLKPDGTPMDFREAVPGGKSVGVPGLVALAAEMHRRWGRLPWAELFQPSIALAREGIIVSERLNRFTGFRTDLLAPEAAAVFLGPDGKPWPVGHLLKQPALAETLERIAREGPQGFYSGPVAEAIARAVSEAPMNPAPMTPADLAAYRVAERAPLCRPYRRWRLCTMGPPSAGGIAVLQTLLLLERFDMAALGPDNPLAWHLFAEALRLAMADREAFGADGDFAPVPVEGLLSRAYIAGRSQLIRFDRAMAEAPAGSPPGMAARNTEPLADVPATSHLAAADRFGNLANVTSTIEAPFGSGLLAAGVLLNNQLTDFDLSPVRDGGPAPNRVEPGKRPRSSMAPTIVLDSRGQPVAAFGAAGGATIIAQVAKTILAHLDWGMQAEEALAAPTLMADRRGLRYEEGTRLAGMAATFTALGHRQVAAANLPIKGQVIAREGRRWRAAADPRSEGASAAHGR
jgi:gamma-glutamyltranspeptidase/glutathione hydrolase